jgi:hypothetical protein
MARGQGGSSTTKAAPRGGTGDGRSLLKLSFAEAPISPTGTKLAWVRKLVCPAPLGDLLARFRTRYPELERALPLYDPASGTLARANEKGLWLIDSGPDELSWEHEIGSHWLVNVEHGCLLRESRKDGVRRSHYRWVDGGEEFEENGVTVPAFSI